MPDRLRELATLLSGDGGPARFVGALAKADGGRPDDLVVPTRAELIREASSFLLAQANQTRESVLAILTPEPA